MTYINKNMFQSSKKLNITINSLLIFYATNVFILFCIMSCIKCNDNNINHIRTPFYSYHKDKFWLQYQNLNTKQAFKTKNGEIDTLRILSFKENEEEDKRIVCRKSKFIELLFSFDKSNFLEKENSKFLKLSLDQYQYYFKLESNNNIINCERNNSGLKYNLCFDPTSLCDTIVFDYGNDGFCEAGFKITAVKNKGIILIENNIEKFKLQD
ncbi:MAG: hypothetical protein SNJ77_04255 [Cytophagales bacterium]